MAEQKRRLAAILSADVAGYSRLMQDDEAATVESLTKYREIFQDLVGRHDGRIVDSPGDNVLAEFASPVEAVEAAVEIQRELGRRNKQLAEHRQMHFRIGINLGDVIGRDDGTLYGDGVNVAARLEGLAEEGGILIAEDVHRQIEGKLEISFVDVGQHEVKNIAKPVRAYQANLDTTKLKGRPSFVQHGRMLAIASAAVVLIVVGISAWRLNETPEQTSVETKPVEAIPAGQSIAVLAFDNMSSDPAQEHFADGMVEGIITGLSRFRRLRVMSRKSTFKYKDQAIDVRDVGRELGVEYVLEGSVQRDANLIRVTAQLLSVEDGAHLWAETFDRDLSASSIFEIQDEIQDSVVGIVGGKAGIIGRAELDELKRRGTDDLEAYDCWLMAMAALEYTISPEGHLDSRDCLEKAVEIDPNFADAWSELAQIHVQEFKFGYNPRPGDPLDRALKAAQTAVQIDPAHETAHKILASTHFFRGDLDAFFVQAERAIELNPYDALTHAEMGVWIAYAGNWERGMDLTQRAISLSAQPPGWFFWLPYLAHYLKEEYEAALINAQKINMPDFFLTHIALATSYAQLGRETEAQAAMRTLLELKPDFGSEARDTFERRNMAPDVIAHILDGLRKAGLDISEEPVASH